MPTMFERYAILISDKRLPLLYFITAQAQQLAIHANEYAQNKDWWWLVQIGKCYHRYAQTFLNQ